MKYELVLTGKFKRGLNMLLVETIKGIENVIFSQIGY